jgi:UDP-N-acetylmuramyl pentapeptide phosphotransferase/UDP-N-acetylglucosamine-1-phosphate transferase
VTSALQPTSILIVIAVLLIVSHVALQIGKNVGPIVGLMDHPNWRKQHARGIPTTGSFALFASLVMFSIWYLSDANILIILIGAGSFYLLGLIDDITPLPATFKLTCQILITAMVSIQTDLTVFNLALPQPFDTFGLTPLVAPLSAIALTILVSNGFNLIDGHDGVAAGISIFTVLAMVPVFGANFDNQITLLSIFIVLPMVVFWVQNSGLIGRKLFLGDSGSLTLGYLISWMTIYQLNQPSPSLPNYNHMGYFLWLVFIPCVDALAVMLHRIWLGKPIFQPDRSHLHHLLTNTGIDRVSVMVFILWLHATFIACGWVVMKYIPLWSYQIGAVTALVYITTTHRFRGRVVNESFTQ